MAYEYYILKSTSGVSWFRTNPRNNYRSKRLTGELEGGVPVNQLGGFSAIEYSGQVMFTTYFPDRGAGDGAVSYPCRVQKVSIKVDTQSGDVQFEQLGSISPQKPKGRVTDRQ